MSEKVLCFERSLLDTLGNFQGLKLGENNLLAEILNAHHLSLQPRELVEDDPTYKQIIPYVILRHTEGAKVTYFSYRRDKGGESRLENKRSIGVGGHLSQEDLGRLYRDWETSWLGHIVTGDRKSTRLNSSHSRASRMPSSA